jgi:hypothetical protein
MAMELPRPDLVRLPPPPPGPLTTLQPSPLSGRPFSPQIFPSKPTGVGEDEREKLVGTLTRRPRRRNPPTSLAPPPPEGREGGAACASGRSHRQNPPPPPKGREGEATCVSSTSGRRRIGRVHVGLCSGLKTGVKSLPMIFPLSTLHDIFLAFWMSYMWGHQVKDQHAPRSIHKHAKDRKGVN